MKGAALEVVKATGSVAAVTPIWNEAVGSSIAKNAQPSELQGDVLVVACSSLQWADALGAQHDQIVACLKPSLNIRSLRLTLRSPPPPR